MAVLLVIDDATKANGYAPSIVEIGRALGIKSTNGVNDHLAALERKGLVVSAPKVARSTRLTKAGKAAVWAHRLRAAHPECSGGEP